MIITGMSRSKRLNVLSRQQLYALFERTGRTTADEITLEEALDIARRSRAEAVVMGSFARLGDTIRIDAQIHDAQTGQLIASEFTVADKPDQILDHVDLLSVKLASHIAPTSAEQVSERGLGEVMTTNLQAYRYYSLALEKTEALRNKDALELLERSLELDPEFAMSHALVGEAVGIAGLGEELAEPAELEFALQAVMRGETYLTPAVSKQVVQDYLQGGGVKADPLQELTPRQREVLQLIAEGHSTKEIASKLNLSIKTVETHRGELMNRLNIHDVAGLVRYAIRTGLVTPDS